MLWWKCWYCQQCGTRTNWMTVVKKATRAHICGPFPHPFVETCPETPNLTHFTKSKWRQKGKNQQTMKKSKQFWKVSGYISIQNFRLFSQCVLRKMPRSLPERTDGQAEKRSRLVGWTNGTMYRWEEGIRLRSDGQTDGRTTRKRNASGA